MHQDTSVAFRALEAVVNVASRVENAEAFVEVVAEVHADVVAVAQEVLEVVVWPATQIWIDRRAEIHL